MRSDAAKENRQRFAKTFLDDLRATDPEFCAMHDNLGTLSFQPFVRTLPPLSCARPSTSAPRTPAF